MSARGAGRDAESLCETPGSSRGSVGPRRRSRGRREGWPEGPREAGFGGPAMRSPRARTVRPPAPGDRTDAEAVLSLAVLALIASPAFAGKFNKVVSVGDKAPTFAGIPAVSGDQDTSAEPQRHQGRRGRRRLPRQPLPGRHRQRGPAHRPGQRLTRARASRSSASPAPAPEPEGAGRPPGDQGAASRRRASTTSTATTRARRSARPTAPTNTPQFFVLDKDRNVRYTGALDDSA